ncbi:MAG: flagellar M-ring protein FliF [Chitinivibrionales bacterium]|nr:flagellar M-ring protein FliF [Chitinivibrionales bacterium]MBD3358114.1 flagellar M-ring protein FliF [Chitinivibrionales bacterium]
MSEFFKQLIGQLSAIWRRLSTQQKIITSSLVGLSVLGLVTLVLWSREPAEDSGWRVLYSSLQIDEAAEITQQLDEGGYKYKLENDGRTLKVQAREVYEIRMALAREGLPKSSGVGYELFDKNNLGVTDFVQKLNARRALEGELQRTIEGLEEVKAARVHVVIPEPTIFLDEQEDPKASVVIKLSAGNTLSKNQIRGISHVVSSSVEGLKPEGISIVDFEGRLLSNPFGDDETALVSSRNMELQQNVERYFEKKVEKMMVGVLGPGKAAIQVAADLNFDQVEKTMELYDPESRVIRSEERIDENTRNAPDGDHQRERSLTNYEIDKTVEHIVREVGNVKRMTVSVAVDGRRIIGEDGKDEYVERTAEELANLEEMVKNAVGYDLARGDRISVANVKFDNDYLRREQRELREQEVWEMRMMIAKYVGLFLIAVMLILFMRYLARTIAEAMNPPVPQIEPLGPKEEETVEVPDEVRAQNELLERVEMMTREEPVNIAAIVRQWLREPVPGSRNK